MTDKDYNYRAVRTAAEFTKWVDLLLSRDQPFGFDIETGFVGDPVLDKIALKTMHPQWRLVGFSFSGVTPEEEAAGKQWARYVPIAHDDDVNVDDPVQVARDLWRLLQSGNAVAHNAAFELKGTGRWFREMLGDDPEYGPQVTCDFGIFPLLGDSQLLAFVADLWQGQKHKYKNTNVGQDLKSLVWHVFGHKMIEFMSLFEEYKLKKQSHARFNMLPLSATVVKYACEDALWCLKLWRLELEQVKEDEASGNYSDLPYKIELDLLPVVARMDQRGLPLDWTYMQTKLEEAEELRAQMNDEILQEISDELGDEVMNTNLGSPKQVAELLYDKLGVPQPRERGEFTRSTAEKPLQSLAKENKVVRDILTYRTVVKLIGSYLKKYLTQLNYGEEGGSPYAAEPGKAYPSHNQTGAISGRFSVDGMSYQQLPKPYRYILKNGLEYHLAFREVIKAPEDFRIVGFDYSQIQLRMMAGFAQEKAMINAFARGTDIHTATASSMLKVPVDEVTDKQRSKGKTLNFSIVFGQGPDALANSLTSPEDPVTKEDAEKLLQQYYAGFPALSDWMQGLQETARTGHYVRGLFGRRYKIWEHESALAGVRSKGDRTAVNEPIQGAEALYAKLAMVRADKAIRKAGLQDKIHLVIMVHDALEFYVHNSISTQEVIDLLGPEVSFDIEELDPNFKNFPFIAADWHEGPSLGALVEIELDDDGKIDGYSMKMEVVGTEKQKWTGDTFESVFSQYETWRKTEHPEIVNRKRAREGTLEAVRAEMPKEVEQETASKSFEIYVNHEITPQQSDDFVRVYRSKPGNNSFTIITPTQRRVLKVTSGLDLSDVNLVSLQLEGATMSEVKSEVEFDEEEIPF